MGGTDQKEQLRLINIIAFIIFFVSYFVVKEFVFSYKMESWIRKLINLPEYTIFEENYGMILKYDSLKKEDFSDHWRFSRISVGEKELEPGPENNFAFESIYMDFDGSYDGHEISIFYLVDLYQPDIDLEEEFQVKMLDLASDENERPIELYSYLKGGDIQYVSRCSNGQYPTSCRIIFHSSAKFGRVTLYTGDWIIPEDTLNEIISELINLIL